MLSPSSILSPHTPTHPPLKHLLLTLLLAGLLFGAAMGSYPGPHSLLTGARPLQILYSALKVPMLLLITFTTALPSFFILNTLLGVRDDFPAVLRALASTQAALTLILASLCPLTLLLYSSTSNYNLAITFNGLLFLTASLSAQLTLKRHYQPLLAKHRAHAKLLKTWLLLYTFVGIQSAWTLRPFIGSPEKPTTFFRQNAWGNAYEELTQILLNTFH